MTHTGRGSAKYHSHGLGGDVSPWCCAGLGGNTVSVCVTISLTLLMQAFSVSVGRGVRLPHSMFYDSLGRWCLVCE